jgi:AcrR family transcriptional regulator
MRTAGGKRDLIKGEALKLFVEHGVDAVSVRDIAAACEMKASNLYAHFASKDALVAELFSEGYAEYGALIREQATAPGPFRVRLEQIVRAICRLHDEDNIRLRFLVMTQHGFLCHVARDERNPVEVIYRAVSGAMDAGEIPHREPELMAMALIGLTVQPPHTYMAACRAGCANAPMRSSPCAGALCHDERTPPCPPHRSVC